MTRELGVSLAMAASLTVWRADAAPDPREQGPAAEDVVAYRIEVQLDPQRHTLEGRQSLSWRNTTATAATELQFHLYLNAFKNSRTTFMKESGGVSRGHRFREGEWGYIDLSTLRERDSGADLLALAEFIRPDDGNPDDETVLRVPLASPVAPGASIHLEIEFAARLPRVFARTGYKNDFHMVAQWYPKIGVLEESGWNCHQFHAASEFFADFGRFDVSITAPAEFVVGATGRPSSEPALNADGTRTHRYVQERVHDFAWTADPDFVKVVRVFDPEAQADAVEELRVSRALGRPARAGEAGPGTIEVTLLLQPEHRSQVDRHFAAAFQALKWFGAWYGPYPYPTLTIVDPAYGARGAGGMEYPTLITAGADYVAPARRHSPESVIIHELAHQYWYGIVANDEFEEAFLDEGFASYSQGLVLEKWFGPNRETVELSPGIPYVAMPLLEIPASPDGRSGGRSLGLSGRLSHWMLLRPFGPSDSIPLNALRDLPFLNFIADAPIDQVTAWRRRYLKAPRADSLARRSWEYLDQESYGLNSYARTALALKTLERILGQERMIELMRRYFETNQFKHPRAADFMQTLPESGPEGPEGGSPRAFFRQAISGAVPIDYAVGGLSSDPVKPGRGVFGRAGDRQVVKGDEAGGGSETYNNELLVKRLGEIVWPQQIQMGYADGSSARRSWDGAYRWIRIVEQGQELWSARVDPEGKMALDINQSNNSRTTQRNAVAGAKWWLRLLQWMQHVAYFYSGVS